MQKPKFRTVEKSAWLFVTTRLHPTQTPKVNRRTATRNGYLSTASALLSIPETSLPTPFQGETIARFVARVKSARSSS